METLIEKFRQQAQTDGLEKTIASQHGEALPFILGYCCGRIMQLKDSSRLSDETMRELDFWQNAKEEISRRFELLY